MEEEVWRRKRCGRGRGGAEEEVGPEEEEGNFWMSEHRLKSAYHDLLQVETHSFSSADRVT